jgi:hypothetical protein
MKYFVALTIAIALFVPRVTLAHDWDGDDGHGHKCHFHENDNDQLGLITVDRTVKVPISYQQTPEHVVKAVADCPVGTQPICGAFRVLPNDTKISYALYAKAFNVGYEVNGAGGGYIGCHAFAFSRAIQPAWLTVTAACLTVR